MRQSTRRKVKNGTRGKLTTSTVTEEERRASESQLRDWIDSRLSLGSAPRSSDIIEWSKRNKLNLSLAQIRKAVRLHPSYEGNSHQQREPLGSRKDRLILTNTLGQLHCDIGFFPVVREYETPRTFQYGFLVAKDVLSRYVYLELLEARRDAKTLIRVFKRILEYHGRVHPDFPILSISFDKENAMRSGEMKKFLKEHHLNQHLFRLSRSKAKMAENSIKIIRTKVQRLMENDSQRRWWRILPDVANDMNSEEIVIEGKRMGFCPKDIDSLNVEEFLKRVQKKVPAYFFSQFRIPTQFVKYKFKVGDIVRPKSLLASSQVIGVKRSQFNLEPQRFRIESLSPFVTKDLQVRPGYRCINVEYGDVEIFAEQDIALSQSLSEKDG